MSPSTSPDTPAASDQSAPVVRPGAPGWLRATVTLGRAFDASPRSPASVGKRATTLLHRRRQSAAARDSDWSEIEARRDTGSPTVKTLLSDDLNWGHLETQWDIESRLVPDPWWLPLTHAAQDLRVASLASAVVSAVDRLRHGWDNADAYNLCSTLPRHVGEQLAWLAENAHGWPGEAGGYATPEEWENELRRHATVLTTAGYGHLRQDEDLLTAWVDAQRVADRSGSADDVTAAETAWQQMQEAEAAANEAVAESMRWVADHLHQLWD